MRASVVLVLAAFAASARAYSLSFAADSSCKAIFTRMDAHDGMCVQLEPLGDGRGYSADCAAHTFTVCADADCKIGCSTQPFADAGCDAVPNNANIEMRAHSFRVNCA